MAKKDTLFYFFVIPLIAIWIGTFIGVYIERNHQSYKYQDITPTTTIQVEYDTYRCQIEKTGVRE